MSGSIADDPTVKEMESQRDKIGATHDEFEDSEPDVASELNNSAIGDLHQAETHSMSSIQDVIAVEDASIGAIINEAAQTS